MKQLRLILFGMFLMTAIGLSACSQSTAGAEKIEPAKLEPIEGVDYNTITLTERAAERLDIKTEAVREEEVNGEMQLVVPYSAIIYDIYGATWLYTSPSNLTYVRAPITVDYIDGDNVYLLDGPPVGTSVVTVAVAELYGTDTGVGK